MKVYVINLDKDAEKMSFMDDQLKRLGLEYERVSGVYGKELSTEEKKNRVNYFRWWCAMGRSIEDAEIGCALSHYMIYQRMIRENIHAVCILEDDVILDERFEAQVENVESFFAPANGECELKPRVVLLSNHAGIRFSQNVETGFEVRKSPSGMCTDGYCLNKAAAKALLKANLPICVPCDTWGRWVRNRTIELYHALPSVVRQNQERFGSSTSANRQVVAEMPAMRWLVHKAKRLIGRSLDIILSFIVKG